jgi:hypothetical protein
MPHARSQKMSLDFIAPSTSGPGDDAGAGGASKLRDCRGRAAAAAAAAYSRISILEPTRDKHSASLLYGNHVNIGPGAPTRHRHDPPTPRSSMATDSPASSALGYASMERNGNHNENSTYPVRTRPGVSFYSEDTESPSPKTHVQRTLSSPNPSSTASIFGRDDGDAVIIPSTGALNGTPNGHGGPKSARPPRPSYSEEQKFYIMYARIVCNKPWPAIEDGFTQIFGADGTGHRSKGGLTSVYYRIRKHWYV